MLDAREIDHAISRLEYEESSYPNYRNLAALYIIRDRMGKAEAPSYSEATPPMVYGDSEFLQLISTKDIQEVIGIMDELMDALQVANPRVYNGVMRKIRAL